MRYMLINPRRTPGGEAHWDARIPAEKLEIGLTLRLPVNCADESKVGRVTRCVVQEIHRRHNWIRVVYKNGSNCASECGKIVEEE